MIIPSIDLMDKKAVQLINGKEKVLEVDNVLALAEDFSKFHETAVIDLDRALGKNSNFELIKKICKVCNCRVGGGLRNINDIQEIIKAGAKKVIISSVVFENGKVNIDYLKSLIDVIPKEKIVIAADSFKGKIAVNGWRDVQKLNTIDAILKTKDYCGEFLVTCIENEGKMEGFDFKLASTLSKLKDVKITVAGGVKDLDEIGELTEKGFDIQLGMALYTGKLDINKAFVNSLKYKDSLIPVITKDNLNQILMLAYANKESLLETLNSGFMTYFSRSRKKLWKKGETSGNFQKFKSLKVDCDRDTLLVTVEQIGKACHLNNYSCFELDDFSLFKLEEVVENRIVEKSEKSYTASLTNEMIKEKLKEEILELIDPSSRDNLVWEAADVLYFLLVYLAKNKIKLNEVISELKRRREK